MKTKEELNEEELAQVSGGGGQGLPPEATIADLKVGSSVFAFDKDLIQRWGTVESIDGDSRVLVRFGGGSMFYKGEFTQLEPHTIWRSRVYLIGF